MAFILKPKSESFNYPIMLTSVSESGSAHIDRFEFRFKRVSRTKLAELQKLTERMSESEEYDAIERDLTYIMDVADGWRGVNDENQEPLEFTKDNVRMLLDQYPSAANEIVRCFVEATLGGGKRKN